MEKLTCTYFTARVLSTVGSSYQEVADKLKKVSVLQPLYYNIFKK